MFMYYYVFIFNFFLFVELIFFYELHEIIMYMK